MWLHEQNTIAYLCMMNIDECISIKFWKAWESCWWQGTKSGECFCNRCPIPTVYTCTKFTSQLEVVNSALPRAFQDVDHLFHKWLCIITSATSKQYESFLRLQRISFRGVWQVNLLSWPPNFPRHSMHLRRVNASPSWRHAAISWAWSATAACTMAKHIVLLFHSFHLLCALSLFTSGFYPCNF